MLSASSRSQQSILPVTLASVAGMTLVWCDFYSFGSLATTISPHFFPKTEKNLALFGYISSFVIGLAMRPAGALLFGKLGDRRGRRSALSLSLLMTGLATLLIGIVPDYRIIGVAAPVILIALRALQGLAFGGTHGGALTFVAEHAPSDKRGYYTSLVQIAPMLGLVLSLAAIFVVQHVLNPKSFALYGWRIPFLLSLFIVGLSLYIRRSLSESWDFREIRERGTASDGILVHRQGNENNLKLILALLFGPIMGQTSLWYVTQLYAVFYLQNVLKVEPFTAIYIVAGAQLLGMPFFLIFGALSDKVGRKRIILAGCLLAAAFYVPIYAGMERAAGTNVVAVARTKNPITGTVGANPQIMIDGTLKPAAPATRPNVIALVALVFLQAIFLAAVSGPLGAYCAEAFRPEVRYTSLALTHSLGNGLLGGMLPLISLPLIATSGNIYAGLYCPIALALAASLISVLFLKETVKRKAFNC
jgi:MFS family permease